MYETTLWFGAMGLVLLVGCTGQDSGRKRGDRGRGADTATTFVEEAEGSCAEVCAERAEACQAPEELAASACAEFCAAGRWDAEVEACLDTTSCEVLAEAWFEGEDAVCRDPGPGTSPGTCDATCDAANGLSGTGGTEVDWLQGSGCVLGSETIAQAEAGGAPGGACEDPDDPSLSGAIACAKHLCSCCGGEETFYASACDQGVCLEADEACALAIERSADPFYSAHLCD